MYEADMSALPTFTQMLSCKLSRQFYGMFAGLALCFAAQAAPPTANAVTSVDTTTLPGGKVMVRFNLKNALTAVPAGFTVGNPPRIALDLPDTGNALGKNTVDANIGSLTSVNVVQAGTRTRLVLNLSKAAAYEATLDGKSLLVSLGDVGGASAPVNASARFAEPALGNAHHSIRDVDFRRGAAGESRIVTTLSDANTGINIRQQANGLVVDFIGTDLPKALQRRLDVGDFGTPVQTVETYPLGDNTRMVIKPKGGWEYSAYQTDNNFIVEVKPATDGQKKTADGKVKYSGEKLSLNFQNVEVRAVLQVIADFTGLNIVASDTVTGSLTLRLKDVPWDQALDLILQTKGLDKRQNGNVIWIAPKDELLAKEKQELEAKSQINDLEPLTTEYITLNYMRADEAQSMLYGNAGGAAANSTTGSVNCSAQAQGLTAQAAQTSQQSKTSDQTILTKRGRATYELKTNTLIVTDTARKIQEIRELLSRLDVPARQVMIEARVVIADSNWSRNLGARLGLVAVNRTGRYQTGIGGNQNEASALTQGFFPQQAVKGSVSNTSTPDPFDRADVPISGTGTNMVNFPAATGAAQFGLSLLDAATGNLLSLELSALEADNRGKIISNPRVMTSNQKPAVILNGTQIPYITPGSANQPATVTFKDVFLCLLVDPQILNNDSIIMNVEVQKDDIDPNNSVGLGNQFVPAIATKRVKTQVRVKNGETLVLGGIFDQRELNNVQKVPFLGDVPILGNLFKTTSKEDNKTELIIFLTPRVIDDRVSLN
jgi:type IV pilus assembly protein PilQ